MYGNFPFKCVLFGTLLYLYSVDAGKGKTHVLIKMAGYGKTIWGTIDNKRFLRIKLDYLTCKNDLADVLAFMTDFSERGMAEQGRQLNRRNYTFLQVQETKLVGTAEWRQIFNFTTVPSKEEIEDFKNGITKAPNKKPVLIFKYDWIETFDVEQNYFIKVKSGANTVEMGTGMVNRTKGTIRFHKGEHPNNARFLDYNSWKHKVTYAGGPFIEQNDINMNSEEGFRWLEILDLELTLKDGLVKTDLEFVDFNFSSMKENDKYLIRFLDQGGLPLNEEIWTAVIKIVSDEIQMEVPRNINNAYLERFFGKFAEMNPNKSYLPISAVTRQIGNDGAVAPFYKMFGVKPGNIVPEKGKKSKYIPVAVHWMENLSGYVSIHSIVVGKWNLAAYVHFRARKVEIYTKHNDINVNQLTEIMQSIKDNPEAKIPVSAPISKDLKDFRHAKTVRPFSLSGPLTGVTDINTDAIGNFASFSFANLEENEEGKIWMK